MGASGWSYFTPWQKNPAAALRALRREEAARNGTGDAMEALLEAGSDGTHSILDIIGGVSETPYEDRDPADFGMAYPAPDSWLIEAYGTTRPTRKIVEEKGFPPAEQLERWTAVFFPVWSEADSDSAPQWWYFDGCTGD